MKIQYCIVASDLNNLYYDFFPLVKKFWNKINIKVFLILISDFIPENLQPFKENILLFPPIPNIPTAFIAQNIRILYPCIFPNCCDKEDGIILSDMDLIPLNYNYFHTTAIDYDPETIFLVYRNVIEHEKEYPICFCLASQKVWCDIFPFIKNENDIRTTLNDWYLSLPKNDYQISSPYSLGWSLDQKKLYFYGRKSLNF